MIGVALLTVGIVLGVLAGGAAHELAHCAAARVAGCPAVLDPPRVRDGYLLPAVQVDLRGRGAWTVRAVALAPIGLGAGLVPVVVAVFLFPAIDPALATPPLGVRGGVVTAWLWTAKPGRDDLRRAMTPQATRSAGVSY